MTAPGHSALRPLWVLATGTLAGWMACALWPRWLELIGLTDYGLWYLDSYAVLPRWMQCEPAWIPAAPICSIRCCEITNIQTGGSACAGSA